MRWDYQRCWGCFRPVLGDVTFCPRCRKREDKTIWAGLFVMAVLWGGLMYWAFIA